MDTTATVEPTPRRGRARPRPPWSRTCWSRTCPSTACAASTSPPTPSVTSATVLDRAWDVHPQVSVRPESVRGAALPLRHPPAVVPQGPPAARRGAAPARGAHRPGRLRRGRPRAGASLPAYEKALAQLAATDMICQRPGPGAPVTTTAVPLVEHFALGLDAPICLTWELTYACNLACSHCLSSSGRRDPRELSTAECKAVIDELQRMQVFYVNIGGGEPTVRSDFWELLDYATAHDVGVKFSTNGIKIDAEAARRIAANAYVDVQISIDGATAEVNDAVRGEGSYDTAVRALQHLSDVGRAGQALGRLHPLQHRPARPVQGDRRPVRRPAAADPAAPLGSRRRRLGRPAPDAGAAARALRLARAARRGRADRRLVLPPGRLRRGAAGAEPVRRRPRRLPDRPGRRRLRLPVRHPRPVPRRQRPRPRAASPRVWRESELFLRAARAAERRRLRRLQRLRRLPRRLHGREVLHRPAAGRAGPGVRQGLRRAGPEQGHPRGGAEAVAGPLAPRRRQGRAGPADPVASAGRTRPATRARSPASRSDHPNVSREERRMAQAWFETVAEAQRRAKKALPPSVYMALVAGSERGRTLRGQHRGVRRARVRPARRRAVHVQRDLSTTVHGPGAGAAGADLADRRAGRAPRRGGGGRPGRGRARAPRWGCRRSPASRSRRSSPPTRRPSSSCTGRAPKDVNRWPASSGRRRPAPPGIIVTLDWSFSQGRDWGSPHIPRAARPQDDGAVRARGAAPAGLGAALGAQRRAARPHRPEHGAARHAGARPSSARTTSGCRPRCRPGRTCAGCGSSTTAS